MLKSVERILKKRSEQSYLKVLGDVEKLMILKKDLKKNCLVVNSMKNYDDDASTSFLKAEQEQTMFETKLTPLSTEIELKAFRAQIKLFWSLSPKSWPFASLNLISQRASVNQYAVWSFDLNI